MKKNALFTLFIGIFVCVHVAAQTYPEGTKWTEIRLDTLKYDRWFSEDGQPNYEIREFYVEGQTEIKGEKLNNVYIKREDAPDSLAFYVKDGEETTEVAITIDYPKGKVNLGPMELYDWYGWTVRRWMMVKSLYSYVMWGLDLVSVFDIEEEQEDDFGGEVNLTYSNVRVRVHRRTSPTHYTYDVCIIKGIGVTSWLGPECLFGPADASEASDSYNSKLNTNEHPYRSMLVHFERDGEVLYDVWPQPGETPDQIQNTIFILHNGDAIYDLQGRRVMNTTPPLGEVGWGSLPKGIYIQNGKKVLVK